MGMESTIRVERAARGVATVTMDRPEVRNAFNERLIGDLRAAAEALGADPEVRVVVLTGAGTVFSAGADLNWMRSMKAYGYEENVADSRALDAMLRTLYDLPKPLIGRINGHALGGGTGLAAVCDIAIAADDALFGFTEVTLGLAPAVISPYVVRKVGRSFARAVFVTGERFGAVVALEHGLIHEVVRRMINHVVIDLIRTTQARLGAAQPGSIDEVREQSKPLVGLSDEVRQEHLELKSFLGIGLGPYIEIHSVIMSDPA
jgi:methylglutaconyl-CoA hydratase